jgi:hypothetical protein
VDFRALVAQCFDHQRFFHARNLDSTGSGRIDHFLVRLRHKSELLNGEIFTTLREAHVLIERCGAIITPSGRTPRSAIVSRRWKRSCRPCLDLSYAALRPAPTLANERRILT